MKGFKLFALVACAFAVGAYYIFGWIGFAVAFMYYVGCLADIVTAGVNDIVARLPKEIKEDDADGTTTM